MEEETAISSLMEIDEILTKHKIEFWLESGTLLGAIREGKFISWDYDIDLGTWERYLPRMTTLAEEFCKKGYETYFSPYHNLITIKKGKIDIQLVFWRLENKDATAPLRYVENTLGYLLAALTWMLLFSHRGKVNHEQWRTNTRRFKFILTKISDKISESLRLELTVLLSKIAAKTGNRRGLVVTPSHYFKSLSELEFYGIKFKIPANSEAYLTYYYGNDWRTPKKEWNYVRKDRRLISKTERIGEKWQYYGVKTNPALRNSFKIRKY